MDFEKMFTFTVSPTELVARGTLMFWFLFLIFRFVLRRGSGEIGISDFLFVVILGDAAQNAMIGDGTSVIDGMVLIGTLVSWNLLVDYLAYRFRWAEGLFVPRRVKLVADGRPLRRNMRRELISMNELMAKVRENGLDSLQGVRVAYLESDGEVSIVKAG